MNERKDLVKTLQRELHSPGLKQKRRKQLINILTTLEVNLDNPLFVFENGKMAKTADLTTVAKEIWTVNKIMDRHHFTAYIF